MKAPTSYAEVDRRCAHLKKRGVSAAEIATRRAKWWMDVTAHRRRKARLKKSVRVPNAERLDAIRLDIALAYGLDPRQLFDRDHNTKGGRAGYKSPITGARRAFVVAARRVGYSTTELANYLRRPGAHSSIVYMEQQATDDEKAIADAAILMDADRVSEREKA